MENKEFPILFAFGESSGQVVFLGKYDTMGKIPPYVAIT